MAFKVINVSDFPGFSVEEGVKIIKDAGAEYVGTLCKNQQEVLAAASDADAIVGLFTIGMLSFTGEMMAGLKKCKVVAVPGIGYDGIDLNAATEHGICVVNNPDYCLEEMADHTILLLLALAKKLVITVDSVREGKWDNAGFHTIRNYVLPPVFRLSRQTLGLIGFGNIPRALIPRAKPFFSRIIAHDPYVPAEVLQEFGVEPATMETLLKESDFVSLHSALTEKNHHMMGIDQFKLMKPTAYFVNTARGGLVNEEALHKALSEGIIAGAGLDAMEPEPPAPDSPLINLPNIIITSHTGQYSVEADDELKANPFADIKRVIEGNWPREIAFRNPAVKEKYLAKWRK